MAGDLLSRAHAHTVCIAFRLLLHLWVRGAFQSPRGEFGPDTMIVGLGEVKKALRLHPSQAILAKNRSPATPPEPCVHRHWSSHCGRLRFAKPQTLCLRARQGCRRPRSPVCLHASCLATAVLAEEECRRLGGK